ncbi:MAG: LysM peptidoglycan-binding domain-containing protein [Planctomycetes bacterium]|nr:LysM peptidoglycan-binding domain-containing protein [Planctomycetota bacterium]
MTSDAKVGVLLGLAFIFLIAFIINGLPHLREEVNNNQLTTTMINSHSNPPGIATRQRKVTREVINQNVRFTAPLPKKTQSLIIAKQNQTPKVEFRKTALSEIYVVSNGDSLAVIAKKVYGTDGNKKRQVAGIFKANRKLLKSPDAIYVGQALVIPPLASNKSTTSTILASSTLEKVKSLSKTKQTEIYIVRENDSLWEIAAKQLGSGTRYTEIAELNADILDNQDALTVGMRLKLPAR